MTASEIQATLIRSGLTREAASALSWLNLDDPLVGAGHSSTISVIIYFPNSRDLVVRFKSGKEYKYLDVAPETFHGISNARSQGAYLNQEVKPFHKCVPMEGV